MQKIYGKTATLAEWNEILTPDQFEALTEGCRAKGTTQMELTSNEVLEIIVTWNGGIATADEVRRLISRVYGISFQRA